MSTKKGLSAVNDPDPLTKIKAADQSVTSSTVLVNCTDIAIPVVAGESYVFEIFLVVTAGVFTSDIKLGFTHPGGSLTYGGNGPHNSGYTAGTEADSEWVARPKNTVSPSSTVPYGGGTSSVTVRLVGSYICTTSGTLQLQYAQNTSVATALVVGAGSFITATRAS